MNSREFQSAVFMKMDSCLGEMRELKRIARAVEIKVENIAAQSHLYPIPRPAQKEVGRDLNVASWFRAKVKEESSKLSENATRKYLEFPDHISDEQLNEDMKRCIHNIMCERLKPGWDTMNWNAIYNTDKMLGEQIIKEAALRPEMAVIAQGSGYWAVRKIAEQRQKSTKRAAEQLQARVKVKKENNGSFGYRNRGMKLEDEAHDSGPLVNVADLNTTENNDKADLRSGKGNEREFSNVQGEENENFVEPPPVSMAIEAVSVVEDLEKITCSDEDEETQSDKEKSVALTKEEMQSHERTNLGNEDEGQKVTVNEDLAKLLRSLTPQQISEIFSTSDKKRTENDKPPPTEKNKTPSSSNSKQRSSEISKAGIKTPRPGKRSSAPKSKPAGRHIKTDRKLSDNDNTSRPTKSKRARRS